MKDAAQTKKWTVHTQAFHEYTYCKISMDTVISKDPLTAKRTLLYFERLYLQHVNIAAYP